jgi:hypothetical protein
MSIRRAELSDAKGIAAVHVAAWRVAYRGLLPDDVLDRLSIEDSAKRWWERIAKPSVGSEGESRGDEVLRGRRL